MSDTIKVFIVNQSSKDRFVLTKIFENDSRITLAGYSASIGLSYSKIEKLNPDIVLLDLNFKEDFTALDFLKIRKTHSLEIPVITYSDKDPLNPEVLNALKLGSCFYIEEHQIKERENLLLEKIKEYSQQYQIHKANTNQILKRKFPKVKSKLSDSMLSSNKEETDISHLKTSINPKNYNKPHVCVIGISTGGPPVLKKILPQLSSNFPIPILIVQHMPEGFTQELAKSLDNICDLQVVEAEEGMEVKPGAIIIAKGGVHMRIKKGALVNTISLSNDDSINSHKPSVGALFDSTFNVYGENTMALIMTGMGHDGSHEIAKFRDIDALTIAQDEKSCSVFGMPKVAIRNDAVDLVIQLENLVSEIEKFITYHYPSYN